MSIQSVALQSIHSALADANKQAQRISTAFTEQGDGDIATPAVALIQDQQQVRASSKILRVGEDMDRAVLDILA